jgi:prepilin-type N-terminal cleavage/methylation domain-containing protein
VRPRRGDDAGVTLIEVMVSMTILSIFMVMFTAGMVRMYDVVGNVDASATAQSHLHVTFLRLDTEIRYAEGVSVPARIGTDSYVEFLTTNTGTDICTQLRWHAATSGLPAQLQRRTWRLAAPPTDLNDPGHPWAPLASGVSRVVEGGVDIEPFTLQAPGGPFAFPQLRVRVASDAGPGGAAGVRQTDLSFAALNARPDSTQVDTCTAERPAS